MIRINNNLFFAFNPVSLKWTEYQFVGSNYSGRWSEAIVDRQEVLSFLKMKKGGLC